MSEEIIKSMLEESRKRTEKKCKELGGALYHIETLLKIIDGATKDIFSPEICIDGAKDFLRKFNADAEAV